MALILDDDSLLDTPVGTIHWHRSWNRNVP